MGIGKHSDDASDSIKEAEQRRSLSISQGMTRINSVFSKFGPGFFDGVRQNTLSTLMPQVARQYRSTRKNLTSSLSDRGLLSSSAARESATELAYNKNLAEVSVGNQAEEAVRDTQRDVQSQKNTLISQLVQSQDPNLAAQQAVTAAASIHAPSPIAPLGNFFKTFAETYAARGIAKAYAPDEYRPASPAGAYDMGKNRID